MINDITLLIGNTPLINLEEYFLNEFSAHLYAKLETNLTGSIKDRAALMMINGAIKEGLINQETTIIEATSGNMGISIASIGCIKKNKVIIVMPENMSSERKKIITSYNAKLIETKKELGMNGSISEVKKLLGEIPNSITLDQFNNKYNVMAHYQTGKEILDEIDVDVFVCGIGTGGTISGVGKYLKSKNPHIKIIGVEPEKSPLITKGYFGSHNLQGIGTNFIPNILDQTIIDEMITIKEEEAYNEMRKIRDNMGILVGITSGVNLAAARKISKKFVGKNIVTIFPDNGNKYLSQNIF